MTNSSADAIGRLPSRRRPGACLITSVSAPPSPLVISESAPLRMMRTRLGEPAAVMAARNPSAIDNTATNAITTPAMPTMATTEEPSR